MAIAINFRRIVKYIEKLREEGKIFSKLRLNIRNFLIIIDELYLIMKISFKCNKMSKMVLKY